MYEIPKHLQKYDWYAPHLACCGYQLDVKSRRAYLRGANLREANLGGANLNEANLREANLCLANLNRANLRRADLSGANLRLANLSGADLSRANLSRANLNETNLFGANLRLANLGGADLSRANLFGANLRNANLRWVIGNGYQIKTLIASQHHVSWTATGEGDDFAPTMAIGCEQHPIEDWWRFDNATIEKMENGALDWWRVWKPILRQLVEME